jgi:hypothetical protein
VSRAAAAGDDHLVAFFDGFDMLGEVVIGLAQPDRVAHAHASCSTSAAM